MSTEKFKDRLVQKRSYKHKTHTPTQKCITAQTKEGAKNVTNFKNSLKALLLNTET